MSVLKTWSQDKRVKFWLEDENAPEPEVDRSKIVGCFVTTLNGIDLIKKMYETFVKSMPLNYPFALIAIDGGSGDGTIEYLQSKDVTVYGNKITSKDVIPENITGLCKGTENVAVRMLFGVYRDGKFSHEDFGYIGILHADMEFRQEGWLEKLVNICEGDEQIGILGPRSEQAGMGTDEIFATNIFPCIMPLKVLKDHYEHFGFLIDSELYFAISHCDRDLHSRNMFQLGYKSLAYGGAEVYHPMNGTRRVLNKKYPEERRRAAEHNIKHHCSKWGVTKRESPFALILAGKRKIERTV